MRSTILFFFFLQLTFWGNKCFSQVSTELRKTDLFALGFEEFKKRNYTKSDSVFSIYKLKYPNEIYGYYWCFRSKAVLDSTFEKGSAAEDCLAFIEIAKLDLVKNRSSLLIAYGYMVHYSGNVVKDIPKALFYVEKILEIDPDNYEAQKLLFELRNRNRVA